jgi:hypothetical protein
MILNQTAVETLSRSSPCPREAVLGGKPAVVPSRAKRLCLLALLLAAIILRLSHWPGAHEFRDTDELAYSWGSLQLLEGNLPGIHYAPAGPQTWVGWCYESLLALQHLVFPEPQERSAPLQIRPFLSIDQCLFDAYRDTGPLRQVWVIVSCLCSLAGVVGGFRLGLGVAGLAGAIFFGGTMAMLPLFVDLSVQARPYIVAWSLGAVGLYYTFSSPRESALNISALMMGLAISSRVEMAMLLPLIWSETWHRGSREGWLRGMLRYHTLLLVTFLVVAPWYPMTLLASLRAIFSIRVSTAGLVLVKPSAMFNQLVLHEGMLFHVALFLLGVAFWCLRRPARWFLAAYLLLAGFSVFKGAAFGLRYQGAAVLLSLVAALHALRWLQAKPATAAAVATAALILPAAQSIRLVAETRANYVPDLAHEWVEQHIAPGTVVYTQPWLTSLFPTQDAADATWAEVTNGEAYKRKLVSAIGRRGLSTDQIPRAMSEVNLALERADRRFLFVLGGRQWLSVKRYAVRLFDTGPAFGVHNVLEAFKQTGGVVILRGPEDSNASALGAPAVQWLGANGVGTRIYCSPDVAAKLE